MGLTITNLLFSVFKAYYYCFVDSSNIIMCLSLFVVVALCPNNNEVHIYKLVEDKWEKVYVLQKVAC